MAGAVCAATVYAATGAAGAFLARFDLTSASGASTGSGGGGGGGGSGGSTLMTTFTLFLAPGGPFCRLRRRLRKRLLVDFCEGVLSKGFLDRVHLYYPYKTSIKLMTGS